MRRISEEYDIFVWDGASKKNGAPDVNTFVNIAPDLTQYFSMPAWTHSGLLAFEATGALDLHIQIYEWDGRNAKNISQNPFAHNGGQTWRDDGYWSFVTSFSAGQDLYIRDEQNRTVLKTKGQYKPAWSRGGLLIFCVPNQHSPWVLAMWAGKDVIGVAHGDLVVAMWNNGENVFCSSG